MAGLDPAIHQTPLEAAQSRVDARIKSGHDETLVASSGMAA